VTQREVPADLCGAYLRNGPNPRFTPIGSDTFPFDGDAMVHGVWFDGGAVRYANRFVPTSVTAAEMRAGRALWRRQQRHRPRRVRRRRRTGRGGSPRGAPSGGTRIAVIARDGSGLHWFDSDAFWVWHFANAYEDIAADGTTTITVDYPSRTHRGMGLPGGPGQAGMARVPTGRGASPTTRTARPVSATGGGPRCCTGGR
jgi:carotenoid cleavage dioxygenase-like enzyme